MARTRGRPAGPTRTYSGPPSARRPPRRSGGRGLGGRGTVAAVALLLAVVLVIVIAVVVLLRQGTPVVLVGRCTAEAAGRTVALTSEQAGNAAVISAVAVERGLPARAVTIALATAYQESGIVNLTYGDRDSVGLFQQRPSQGWGSVDEILDPVYSAEAFYSALVQVPAYESEPITEVAQEVQRSAFPRAYADHEADARVLASTLAGFTPAGFSCTLPPARTGDTGTYESTVQDAYGDAVDGSDSTGQEVTVEAAGGDARVGWSLAQWSVARAEELDVVAVSVAGQTWRRDAPELGWPADPAAPTVPGRVLVLVAPPEE